MIKKLPMNYPVVILWELLISIFLLSVLEGEVFS